MVPVPRSLTVLLVDDDVEMHDLIAFFLGRDPTLTVVGEAFDGEAGVVLARQKRPGVVLMDIMMPRLNGLEATRRIKQERPSTKVLVLSSLTDETQRRVAYENGADGVLNKREIATDLIPAIQALAGVQEKEAD
jgi:DNA-binding NarL/FixJ family response regulator